MSSTNSDVVKALGDAGSDVNTRGNSGKWPIDHLEARGINFNDINTYQKMHDLLE